jgi:hypothetical protein
MTHYESTTSRMSRSMSAHDRNVLVVRLLITCAVLAGPLTLMIGLIVYAILQSEQAHPASHRSVASAVTCPIVELPPSA